MENIRLINFVDLTLDEKKMILSWRNNPKIREYMYNQNEISLEKHLQFIENLKNSKDKLYFLVKKGNQDIGVIDFTKIIQNESLHMGIYAKPDTKGYGKILLNEIISYSFEVLKIKKIYAEVFLKNQKAYELYKKLNFTKIGVKEIDKQKVVCMELINENR